MTDGRTRRGAHPAGRRHRGREVALRVLFELDGVDKNADEALAYQAHDMGAAGDVRAFGSTLVHGCLQSLAVVDAAIRGAGTHWTLENLGKVERAVLRLATYELLFEPETPEAVVINEGVELAKAYAGQEAGGFVNGVLGQIAGGARV